MQFDPAITATAAALGSSALTAFIQMRLLKRTQNYETTKLRYSTETTERFARAKRKREHFERAHLILSMLGREFSLGSMRIDWTAKLAPADYDQKYLDLCKMADELRMIADFFADEISESVNELYGLMNVYWGNFYELLRRDQSGDKIEHDHPLLAKVTECGMTIPGKASEAKDRLMDVMKRETQHF